MKNKPLLIVFLFVLIASTFFVYVPSSLAQSELDWSAPINLSNSGATTRPLIVTGTDDVIHVVWIDEFEGYKYTESANGVDWTPPVALPFPFSLEGPAPRFEVTNNGVIHVFWLDEKNNLLYAQTMQANFNSPASWGSQTRLGVSVVDYDVAVDDGAVHVSYMSNNNEYDGLAGTYYRRSLNSGLSWSAETQLVSSPYFRSLSKENAHIRIAVSGDSDEEKVFVVWDNPALKRIIMTKSTDRGQTWDTPFQVIGPDQKSGFETPFKAEIESINNGILLTWQAGESGIRCSQYSIWSVDGGDHWGEAVRVFEELASCPERIGFNTFEEGYGIAVLNIEENLAMIAWNGVVWSNLQIQNGIFSMLNPVTFDPILFHCQNISFRSGNLFTVGCDEGNSKDIWFTSRLIGEIENWFPPPSAWTTPQTILDVSQEISSISSVADLDNNIHVVWTQSSFLDDDSTPSIYYALWDGGGWSKPAQIMVTNGSPINLSLTTDNHGKLFLVWVDQDSGDLLFSWGNSSRANIPLEWASPKILPSSAKLNSSPEILVDDSGNIVVTYAVTLNENRGVYMVRSENLGETWSAPLQIFDAVYSEWDAVDRPKIALTSDGKLHSLFSRYSVSGGIHPMGLYYSQSEDGGATWSDLTEISDKPVIWHQILIGKDQTLNLLWQENYDQTTSNLHRISNDNGVTWNISTVVSSTREKLVTIDVGNELSGRMHLLQLVGGDELILQEWIWDGFRWSAQESSLIIRNADEATPMEFKAEIASNGYLGILTALEKRNTEDVLSDTLSEFGRYIDVVLPVEPLPSVVVPPVAMSINLTVAPNVQSTPTFVSPLVGVNNQAPVASKNTVGLIMIAIVLIVLVVVVRPHKANK